MLSILGAFLVTACSAPPSDEGESDLASKSGRTLTVKLTEYTLVTEAETSGQHTGDTTKLCSETGECYFKEFLCSAWGVAMQGTGKTHNGNLIHYTGDSSFDKSGTWLRSCGTRDFEIVDNVTGRAQRPLIPHESIAVDPNVIRLGWWVWIDSEGRWFHADDTGPAIRNAHIDIYVGLDRSSPPPAQSRIYVTSTPHRPNDPSPFR